MYRKGYLDQQIEDLGRVMAKLLADLIGLKQGESSEVVNHIFQNELGMDADDLAALADNDFVETLKNIPKFDAANLEKLADVFASLAQSNSEKKFYRKSLLLYRYIDASEKIFSAERNAKINRIKAILND